MKKSKIFICFVIAASSLLLQGCKKEENEEIPKSNTVENVKNWNGIHEEANNHSITFNVSIGNKENANWISSYDVAFYKYNESGSGTPFYAVIKSDKNTEGLVKLSDGKAVISIVSSNSDQMTHYFDAGSQIIVQGNPANSTMTLSYVINVNSGDVFMGEVELTLKK